MMWLLAVALVVSGSVQYGPANPTVGDLITINFPDPVEGKLSLVPDEGFEVVALTAGKATVRSFRPGTIRVVGEILTPGQQTQRHTVEIEIRSVLAENDDLQPAPLVMPKELQPNRAAWWAIGIAAASAATAWSFLFVISRRMTRDGSDDRDWVVDPGAAFLQRLDRIARLPDEEDRWRQLADSIRWLLPRIDPLYGPELTTSEILDVMQAGRTDPGVVAVVDRILHGGDWAKFSPFGAPNDPSTGVLSAARNLAGLVSRKEAA